MKTRLKEIMAEKGIMSKTLAEAMGVSLVSVSTLINGKVNNLDTLARAANALNVPMWQLFASSEEIQDDCSLRLKCPHCGKPITLRLEE